RIGAGPERILVQLVAELEVIEDLAVEDETDARLRAAHRLMAVGHVDDRQARMAERGAIEQDGPLRVRTAMPQRGGHRRQARGRGAPLARVARPQVRGEAGNPAHSAYLGRFRSTKAATLLRESRFSGTSSSSAILKS